ncbi:TAXI family TRAP transporter solute-binding subunit [Streptomyces sp. Je 1-4]|uniref:TAXI family TRAP transporter solute-binding subunit n=1 Tax=Streptomyces TaxID=1883 RepID=UPI00140F3BF2|nr:MULTISPECIES: TAXI family TRAP transporter solute-binding subunit [unclassified Streptomyces]QIK06232.1 TAXI family TRAP transporter solute-binding subunit [Streptomyces sp. ID38640]UYB39576.1 TAXI family TRAP transporter solute-binding subunit [Streptomyces sp. Je 1-4]UZQ35618.1 TAXI family TRAP transporter solute-binding subunit [Streptomyces sp. Je 1-4] [Streptomyces sp. Je 1-4 4N24]UZQ43036.1 TAXI family TRAP transporter solute-binding subunit [Streptomyces sp. Je 1-4] [Streptomyces sp. 
MVTALPRTGSRAVQSAIAALVVLGLGLWWLMSMGGTPAPRGQVTLATGVPTGVYARYGELLKQDLAHDLPEVDLRLARSEGSIDNLRQLVARRADFAIATADAVAAYKVRGEPGADRLRACARLYDDYMQLVVPKGSAVRSTKDLRRLRVGVGADGSGVQLITRRLLEAAGLDFNKDIEPVRVGIDRMPELLEQDKLDAFFWSGGLPTTAVQRLAQRFPVRLVQLGDLSEALHRQGERTRYYRAAVMPADAYPMAQGGQAVKTIAVANLLVTTDREDAAMTEGITRTVIDSRDWIGRQVHAAQKVDLRTAVFTDPLELHTGARRYYVSQKP